MKLVGLLILCVALQWLSVSARADCTNPDAPEGTQTYNTTYKTMQFCDGSVWWNMKGGGGSGQVAFDECQPGEAIIFNSTNGRAECPFDHTPDAFSFTGLTGVEPSTLAESDIVEIINLDDDTDISVNGDGSSEYRICDDSSCSTAPAYTSTAGIIDNGQYVQLRLTSSPDFQTAFTATLTVGEATEQWSATTRPEHYPNCDATKAAGNTIDGTYTIDPDGPGGITAFDVYCDMTSDGGGWTLVVNEPTSGLDSQIPEAAPVVLNTRGRLSDTRISGLLAASTYPDNNIRIKVNSWEFGIRIETATVTSYHVPNKPCTGWEQGPDIAPGGAAGYFSVSNGTGGSVGFYNHFNPAHPNPDIQGWMNFRVNLCGGGDTACNAGYGSGCSNRQTGEVWIK